MTLRSQSITTLAFSSLLMLANTALADEDSRPKPIIDRSAWTIEQTDPPEGKGLLLELDNPAQGVGSFKLSAILPVVSTGLAAGQYTLTFTCNFIEPSSTIWIGFRGTPGSAGSPSSFRNTFGGEQWEFAPLGSWAKYSVPVTIPEGMTWSGTVELEMLSYGNEIDRPNQSKLVISDISLVDSEGRSMFTGPTPTFVDSTVGQLPQSPARYTTDKSPNHPGSATGVIVDLSNIP